MLKKTKTILFSDLDGTLLDHETYSFSAAQAALDALVHQKIPLVLASSKTAAEMLSIRKAVGFEHCHAIVENGAGIIAPQQSAATLDDSEYRHIRHTLEHHIDPTLRAKFSGFGDLGNKGICETTGLSPDNAALAAQRSFSEPGLWLGDNIQLKAFLQALDKQSIKARDGGRFLTLSKGRTKAQMMKQICQELFGNEDDIFIVALGDAPNDTEMLLEADRGFIVHNPHAKPIVFPQGSDTDHISRTQEIGPAGWNKAVLSVVL